MTLAFIPVLHMLFSKNRAISAPDGPRPPRGLALLLCSLAVLLLPPAQAAAPLPEAFSEALKTAGIPLTSVSVLVQPVDARAPLIAHNTQKVMNPASVMKLLTTFAALDILGPAYTWKTEALIDPSPVHPTFSGNLYLRGGGDPKLTVEQFWLLLRQLRLRGVQHITGDLILDRQAFDVAPLPALDDKPMRPYNVEPDALLLNFRSLRFLLRPEDQRISLLLETPAEGLQVDNQVQWLDGPCPNDWKDRLALRTIPEGPGIRLEFSGTYASQCGERPLNLSPLTAEQQTAALFRALWKELGGTFTGHIRSAPAPETAQIIARQESPPLSDLVRDINKFSNNVMARHLYLALGEGPAPLTTAKARQRIDQWLTHQGLNFPELEIENGAGLSRRARISADSLNRLLLKAWKSPVMPEFISSLPVAGTDGTMKKRLNATPVRGRAHIKTGTLDGVKTAAGYVLDTAGRRYTLTILINHPRAIYGQPAIDALLLWVASK